MEAQSSPLDLFATGLVNLESRAGNIVGGGRYSLVKVLGRGGMGIVWLAQDARLNIEVALKFLPPQIRYDPAALDDLRRETARSRKLSHPNIIRIHDLYEAPNEDAFISMEFIEGRNMADLRVDEPARVFSWTFLKPLVEQLCAGLEYAHGERIIHCDLKPANLMLDKNGRLKLADFGIARTVSDSMTRNALNQTTGTLLYMSPQQMEGGVPRVTDDIYALGATLYELMTGKPPFYTGDIMHQVRIVSPRPMQERLKELELANDVPAEVEQVVMACLSKNAAHRPQTAADVARLLNGEKVQRPIRVARSRLQVPGLLKENKWWWASAAAVMLGIGVWTATDFAKTNKPIAVSARTVDTISFSEPTASLITEPLAAPKQQAAAVTPAQIAASGASVAAPASSPQISPKNSPTLAAGISNPERSESTRAPIRASEAQQTLPVASRKVAEVPAVGSNKATALQLLQKGNSYVSARSKNRVLEVTSSRAAVNEAPQNWRFLYYDDKTTYNAVEVRFENGEMERVYEPNRLLELFSPSARKTLDLAKVKIDSDRATRISVAEAVAEEFEAKFVELKLERGYGGLPVWNVKLFGIIPGRTGEDLSLGNVIVLAEDGKVLKKAFASKTEKPSSKK